ncbi:hypothetical protein ACWGDX_13545 [Streptomyces sp. NPDC055025]
MSDIIPSASPDDTNPSAPESAVQSLINGGYGERQAREILSFVRGEAREQGYASGQAAARKEIAADFDRWAARTTDSLTPGQASVIVLHGLCECSGGVKPCYMGGTS